MNIYFIEEGEVKKLNSTEVEDHNLKADWVNSILVVAENEADALELASQFDKGEKDGDNYQYTSAITIKAIEA